MRYDFAIIWSIATDNIDEILGILRKHKDLELVFFKEYTPPDFSKFIEMVYGLDTVPIEHLRAKNKYLLDIGSQTYILLLRNKDPKEKLVGEGEFQHIQSETLNLFKWEVREAFNPKKDGKRTENHCIHTSDYEEQTVKFLYEIGEPLEKYTRIPNEDFPDLPYHIQPFSSYKITTIDLEILGYRDIEDRKILLKDSPHVKYLSGNKKEYISYWNKNKGKALIEDHTIEKFEEMKKWEYLKSPHQLHFITVQENTIIDGVHRASILYNKGKKYVVGLQIW